MHRRLQPYVSQVPRDDETGSMGIDIDEWEGDPNPNPNPYPNSSQASRHPPGFLHPVP